MSPQETIWIIAAIATTGVILRPFNWPEAIWAVAGASLLVALQLISPQDVLAGVAKGTDVYLFLIGMMLFAEIARAEGLFDWLAAVATSRARGSARRLFALIYGVGIVVTVFLSNDATAVVLTPAVAAAVRAAKAEKPLPYLLICAFIANAASFVLPISNPANLVIYGNHMPPLQQWLPAYLAALGAFDRGDLRGAALDPAPGARSAACKGGAGPGAHGRRQDGGRRDRRHRLRAACRICRRCAARASDCDRRRGDGGHRARARTQSTLAGDARTYPGACCRWSPDCSCWWRRSPRPASSR